VTDILLRLLYMASPARPLGSFAWSQGLAQACASRLVSDAASLQDWLRALLHYGLGRLDLPLLLRSFQAAAGQQAKPLLYWDSLVLAGRESAELWMEERETGRALMRLLDSQQLLPVWLKPQSQLGYVAAFALLAAQLGCRAQDSNLVAEAFTWSWLENQVTAAAKCLPLGQSAAQGILLSLTDEIVRTAAAAALLEDDDIGASLPGQAIASARHEGQHSRMFRS
jgi:urease accessory protein